MFGSAVRSLVFAFFVLSSQAFAQQLTIQNGDSTWSIGRVEWALEASGGTGAGYAWSFTGTLPPGLALRTDYWSGGAAGLIGVATTPGTYAITLRVENSGNIETKGITIKILGLVTTCDTELADASVGMPYSKTITTAGASDSVSFALQADQLLPDGLTLHPSSGIISGTPTTPGDYWFWIDVSDRAGTIQRNIHMLVSPMHITSPASLPNGVQGTPYSQTIQVAGGTLPYNFQLHCCTPAWLSLNSSTGVLSGTPNGPGFWGFTIDIGDAFGRHLRKHFQLGVTSSPAAPPSLNANSPEDITIGEYNVLHIGTSGGTPPYTWSVTSGSLPPGMMLGNVEEPRPYSSISGVWLTGTPTTHGFYTFTIRVSDSSAVPQSASWIYMVRVSPLSFNGVPNGDLGAAYSQSIRILGGTAPYSVVQTRGAIPSGLTLDNTGLISGIPTESGGFWFQYRITDSAAIPNSLTRSQGFGINTSPPSSINIQDGNLGSVLQNQSLNWSLWGWGGSNSYNWTVESGTLPAGLTVTGSASQFATLSGIPTAAGNYIFTLCATDAGNPNDYCLRVFQLSVTPLQLTVSTNLGWINIGDSYSTNLTLTGNTGTVSWGIEPGYQLPEGMKLTSGGVLSGTPTSPGQYWFNVRATDPGTGSSLVWQFYIVIYPAGQYPPVSIDVGSDLGTWNVGRVDYTLNASGGTGTGYSYRLISGILPAGIVIDNNVPSWVDGNRMPRLVGVTTAAGNYNFRLQLTDSEDNTATRDFSLKVIGLTMTSGTEWADASVGDAYSRTITTSGDTGTVSFALASGSYPPAGLSLNPTTGMISGTPTVAGDYRFSINITGTAGTMTNGVHLYVSPMRITSPAMPLIATQGAPYSQNILIAGGTAPYTFTAGCCTGGWLSLSSSGVLSGTPNGPGFSGFTVDISDANGWRLRKHFQIGVIGTPPVLASLSSGSLEDITLGQFTSREINTFGGTPPYTWTVASGSLPPGMMIAESADQGPYWRANGTWLLGRPTALGLYSFTIQATDSSVPAVSTRQSYTLRVSALFCDGVPNAEFGVAYSERLRIFGGTAPYGVEKIQGNLPTGMTLGSDGLISGTPGETVNPWFQIRITDSTGGTPNTFTHGYNLNISTTPPSTTWIHGNGDLGYPFVNQTVNWNLWAGGGSGTYHWTVEPWSSLPVGLSIGTAPGPYAVVYGTVGAAGNYSFTLRATDVSNSSDFSVRTFRYTVTPLQLSISTNLGWINIGDSYSTNLTLTGNTGTVSWGVEPGYQLPEGMHLTSDGILWGTPTSPGQYWFTLRATDAGSGSSRTWGFYIVIYPAGGSPPVWINSGSNRGTWSIGSVQSGLSAQGGNGTYTWSLLSGALPPGILLRTDRASWFSQDTSASLSGVATTTGLYSFTLKVESGGWTDTRAFTMKIVSLGIKDSGSLPDAFIGQPFSYAFSHLGGTGSITWSAQPGNALPAGLTFSSAGVLSGTPTTAGTYNFSIYVTDNSDTVSRGYSLTVYAVRVATRILPSATQGIPYTHGFVAENTVGDIIWTTDGPPPGLTLLSNGTLTGTPGQAGTWSFWVTVTDSYAQFYRAQYSLNVVGLPPVLPSISFGFGTDISLGSGTTLGLSVSGGKAPYTWSAGGLPPGMSLLSGVSTYRSYDPAGAVIWGTPVPPYMPPPSYPLPYEVTISVTDSASPPVTTSRIFPLRVVAMAHDGDIFPSYPTRGQSYSATIRIIGETMPYTWGPILSGMLPAGLTLTTDPVTGMGKASGTPLENTNQCPTILVTDKAAKSYISSTCFNVGGGTTTININTSWDLGSATLGQNYSRTLSAWGAPSYTWSKEDGPGILAEFNYWPLGLTLSPGGVISGTPTVPKVYKFLVRAADPDNPENYGIKLLVLNVTPLVVSGTTLGSSAVGSNYTSTLAVTGNSGAVSWILAFGSLLPPGLALNSSTGVISGSPTSAGNYYFSLVVSDPAGSTSRTVGYNISIYPAGQAVPIYWGTSTLLGSVYASLQDRSGYPAYNYSYAPSATPIAGVRVQTGPPLPSGWSSPTNGAILGVVTTPGTYNTTVRMTDDRGQTFDHPVTMNISPIMPLDGSSLPRALVDTEYSFTFRAAGGTAPYTWSVQTGSTLPPGLVLSGAVLTGTTFAANYGFNLQVNDSAGNSVVRSFNLLVMPYEITTAAVLPQGTVNVPYSVTLTANSSSMIVAWAITSRNLPTGFTLDPSTGIIAGTPTGTWNSYFTVRATDSDGRMSYKNFSLIILSASAQSLSISTGSTLADIAIGRNASYEFYAAGGTPPYTWSLEPGSTPPPGLDLFTEGEKACNSCAVGITYLAGRPFLVGDCSFTLRVTDAAASSLTRTFTLKVAPLSIEYENLPISGTTLTYNTPYTQTMLGIGGTGTYVWAAEGLMPWGLSLSADGVISGTPMETGGFNVPVRITDGNGATIRRTVYFNIASSMPVILNISPGSDLGTVTIGSSFSRDLSASGSPLTLPNYVFSVLGSLPSGCALLTGDAMPSGTTSPARLACNLTSPGLYGISIRVDDSGGNYGVRTFTLRATQNVIFTTAGGLYNAVAGTPYSQRLLAWGASQTWDVNPGSLPLPPGLSLAADGTLSGTPTTTGTYSFTLRLTDGSGFSITRTFNMTVAGLAIADPGIIPVQAISGEPYSYTFTATGSGSKTWSLVGTPPAGFSLSSSGTLSGMSPYEGIYGLNVQVTDGSTTFTKLFSFVVRHKYSLLRAGGSPVLLGEVLLNQSYSSTLANGGGQPPYTWSLKSGSSLPPSLTLISGADLPANFAPIATVLAGTPSQAGSFSFVMQLADSAGGTSERTFQLKVSALSQAAITPRSASYNVPYSQQLTTAGGTAPYGYSITSGVLPPGLTLSTSGLISGTPTNTGSWSITVRAVDSSSPVSNDISRSYTLSVNATAPYILNISNSAIASDRSAGTHWTSTLSASGGTAPYSWELYSGTLPAGISIVQGSALLASDIWFNPTSILADSWYLSGRTDVPGLYTFTLHVRDSLGNYGYKTITQRISGLQQLAARPRPPAIVGAPITIQLVAAGGTPPYTFALASGSYLPVGLTLNADGTITGTPTESGSYSYSCTVTDSASPIPNSLTASRSFYVYPAGLPVPLQAGSSDGIVLGFATSEGSAGSAYLAGLNASLTSGVTPYAWSLASGALPLGMSLIPGGSANGGYLVGAPASAGANSFGLLATDSAGQTLTMQVSTEVSTLDLSPNPVPPATVATPYSVTFAPTGGTAPYTMKLLSGSALPPGVTLSGMTLSGTPTIPGSFVFGFSLKDSLGDELRRVYTIYVDSPAAPVGALSVSPANIRITYVAGSTLAVPVNIESGAASVNFTAAVAGISGASLSATSGLTPQAINLLLPNSLAVGTHYGVVEINSLQVPNWPLAVRVVATVVAPPPCGYTVSPAAKSVGSSSGSGSFEVNATRTNCGWQASTSDSWITIINGNGPGNGTVTYSFSSNPDLNPRIGTITVNGQTHTVTQFGSSCAWSIDPIQASLQAAGGGGTIAVNTSLSVCTWTAAVVAPSDSWIHITSGSSGTGAGNVSINVDPNPYAASRSGSLTIAGITFTVNQAGAGCTISLSSGGTDIPSSGGNGSVDVTTNGCGYSTAAGPNWITITSGGSGLGSGTVSYSIAPNSSTQSRSGTLMIGGQPYQITQAGVECSFTIGSNNTLFGSSGGPGVITVTPNGLNCGWTASSSSSWSTITFGATGMGPGHVDYTVSANSAQTGRSGSITVAGQTVTISQAGITCGYELRSSSGSMPTAGGTGAAEIISAATCGWTASSNAGWLSVLTGAGSGSGEVAFTAQPNPTATSRTGTITITGVNQTRTYSVTQAGVPCTYTLVTISISVGPAGSPSSTFRFTTQTGCTPVPVSRAYWITDPTASFDPGSTTGTVTFAVAANPLTSARSGTIQLGDQSFTVNQTASACAFSLSAFGAIYDQDGGNGSVLASASQGGCQAPTVGASPELQPPPGPPTPDPNNNRIWIQLYTVPPFASFNLWIRVLYLSFNGEIFTIKQTSWK